MLPSDEGKVVSDKVHHNNAHFALSKKYPSPVVKASTSTEVEFVDNYTIQMSYIFYRFYEFLRWCR